MERPWIKWYDEGVPAHINYPSLPPRDFFNRNAGAHPNRPYIVFNNIEISYSQANIMARKLANGLMKLGVKKGDRVGFLLPNIPHYLISAQACYKIAAIMVPANPLYTAKELSFQFTDSGTETVIVMAMFADKAIEMMKDSNNPIQRVIVVQVPTPIELKDEGTYNYDEVMASGEDKEPNIEVTPEDIAILQYTGGTTGVPKGCMLTNANIVAISYQDGNWFNQVIKKNYNNRVLAVIPLYHVFGFNGNVNIAMFMAGTIILVAQPTIENILAAINNAEPNFTVVVPAMIIGLNNHPDTPESKIKSLDGLISGSSPLAVEALTKFEEISGAKITEGYGLSESSNVLTCNPMYTKQKIGTVGLPWPDVDIKIVDLETGTKELPYGEAGELIARGPQVMKGYWQNPEATAEVLRDGWLFTGDIAAMDEEGYITIVDRKKDMVLSSGFNVYPREIDEVMYAHPKVMEACAIGVPDEKRGQSIKVFVVPKPGEIISEEEVIDHCRKDLAPYKIPKYVEFLKELPRTSVGKPDRKALAAIEQGK